LVLHTKAQRQQSGKQHSHNLYQRLMTSALANNRGSLLCETEDDICGVVHLLEESPGVRILRLKNRFRNPTPGD
jgi:hypothetical protein